MKKLISFLFLLFQTIFPTTHGRWIEKNYYVEDTSFLYVEAVNLAHNKRTNRTSILTSTQGETSEADHQCVRPCNKLSFGKDKTQREQKRVKYFSKYRIDRQKSSNRRRKKDTQCIYITETNHPHYSHKYRRLSEKKTFRDIVSFGD